MAGTDLGAFNKRIHELTDEAIRESLAEISVEFEKRFGPAALTASPPVVSLDSTLAEARRQEPIYKAIQRAEQFLHDLMDGGALDKEASEIHAELHDAAFLYVTASPPVVAITPGVNCPNCGHRLPVGYSGPCVACDAPNVLDLPGAPVVEREAIKAIVGRYSRWLDNDDCNAIADAILALTPVEGVGERITREARLRMFLEIIDADGGHETIDDGSWANAFTEEYEKQSPDTINWAAERGFINVTFNDMFETSTAHLTKAGREHLSTPVAQGDEVREALRTLRYIVPYLDWTIGSESPGYHPTMPSAVAEFKTALATLTKGARDAG